MLSISIEKQTKRQTFFKFVFGIRMGAGLAGGGAKTCQTEVYYRIVFVCYCFRSFRLVSEGNARLFTIMFGGPD